MNAKCLCGAVSLNVQHNNRVKACHCGMCHQWNGGAYFSVMAEQEPEIKGKEWITHYRSSEWAERAFCKQCGTHLYYYLLPTNQYYVSAGLFQGKVDFELAMEIYVDCKVPFYELANDVPKLTGREFLEKFGFA